MASETKRVDFEEIKRAASMSDVVSFLSIPGLKPRGRSSRGPCPFCKGQDCFVVTDDGGRERTGAFNCFKCPEGGDQIELVSRMRGHPRRDREGVYAAARELEERFIGPRGAATGAANASPNASPQPREGRRSGFDPEAYAKTLDPAHEALAGLGIDPETLRQWRAGFASSGVNRGRLALPVATAAGQVVGYMGRATKDEPPKLTFPNGLEPREHIFGADRVSAGPLYLVRDPLDVLKAAESGCGNAVCFLTEDVAAIQLEALAALMDERRCDYLSFF